MKKRFTYLLLLIGIAIMSSCNNQERGWKSLFDGQTLSGWIDDKGGCYVEDNAIVGEMSKVMRYLRTEQKFDNFILEIDFKVDSGCNSGVQLRSYYLENDKTCNYLAGTGGKLVPGERTYKPGEFCGYQIEIECSDRAWCGGFFDQGGRGWLQPLIHDEPARNTLKQNDWNHFKIIADKDHFQSWLNGAQATDFYDKELASAGYIGLQFHSTNVEKIIGRKIRFKNIRIKEL